MDHLGSQAEGEAVREACGCGETVEVVVVHEANGIGNSNLIKLSRRRRGKLPNGD